jgi:hypothetical protein
MGKLIACLSLAAFALSAQSTTTYTFPPQGCVQISNCIIQNPALPLAATSELWSTTKWSLVMLFNSGNGSNAFNCASENYSSAPPPPYALGVPFVITVNCTGSDGFGAPFSMNYNISAHTYKIGGRIRYWITGATVLLTH